MDDSKKAQLLLIMITMFWGLTFPLLHDSLAFITPQQLVFLRFLLASLLLIGFVIRQFKKTSKIIVCGGAILAIFNLGIYLFQTIGLQTVDASRAAFITGANVVLIPFFSPLFRLGRTRLLDITSVGICLFGIYILTGANLSGLSIGDAWVSGSTICTALSIVMVQWLTMRTHHYLLLTFYQLFFTTMLTMLFVQGDYIQVDWPAFVWFTIVFCAVFASVLALFIQIRYQGKTTAVRAGMIFTLEPVFASIFSWLIDGESFSIKTVMGGLIILLSILLPGILAYRKGHRLKKN